MPIVIPLSLHSLFSFDEINREMKQSFDRIASSFCFYIDFDGFWVII